MMALVAPPAPHAAGDYLAHIDLDLMTEIAKVQIAYQAKLAGIGA